MKLDKHWPARAFFMFFALLTGAYLYYVPSWGLQDDFQSLGIARSVWQSANFLGSLWTVITSDLASWGIFRPVYYFSVVVNYHFFKDVPWLIYILIAIFNFSAILLWGIVITRLFSVKENYARSSIFLFPLSFFIFTPFWNIFVHISFQEKFIVFFTALSLYFLQKAYDKDDLISLIPAMLSMVLGVLSKPTGIHLAMACIVFSVIDLVFLKYKKRVSRRVLLLNTGLFMLYYWFITSNLRGYAGQYSLTFANIINNLLTSSMVVKLLIVAAIVIFLSLFVTIFRKKSNFSPLALIIPLGFLSYVLVLAPWRFASYLLSALTPYVLAMFFPIYIWFNYKNNISRVVVNACLILLAILSFSFIAVPRISKLADIREAEEFIISSNKNNDRYFFPPPFSEAAEAVSGFTSTRIVYLDKGVLDTEKLHSANGNYLIVNDEASAVILDGVKIGKTVYENNTWKIFQLAGNRPGQELFKVGFPENPVVKVKSFLRDF